MALLPLVWAWEFLIDVYAVSIMHAATHENRRRKEVKPYCWGGGAVCCPCSSWRELAFDAWLEKQQPISSTSRFGEKKKDKVHSGKR